MKMQTGSLELRLNRGLDEVSARDYQLWSIGVLVMLVLLTGVLALVAPSALWRQADLRIDTRYVPQLLLGLISLVVLLNFYLISQKRQLHNAQQRLVAELVETDRLQQFSLIDRATGVFTKAFLHEVVGKESAHANRHGKPVTFIVVQASSSLLAESQPADERLAIAVANILRSTFRGSDTIIRMQDDLFLVVLPETNDKQATIALRRLAAKMDFWNANPQCIEILLQFQTASYEPDGDMWQTIYQVQELEKRPIGCMSDQAEKPNSTVVTTFRPIEVGKRGTAFRASAPN